MNDETIFKPIGKISMSIENVRKKKMFAKIQKIREKNFFSNYFEF